MGKYIGENLTDYSTADLESICEEVYRAVFTKSFAQTYLGKLAERQGRWQVRVLHDILPVSLGYLHPEQEHDFGEKSRPLSEGIRTFMVKGPFYTGYPGVVLRGLAVASPADLAEILGPMESLALSEEGAVLPRMMLGEILFHVMKAAGVEVGQDHGTHVVRPLNASLFLALRDYALREDLGGVRLMSGDAEGEAVLRETLTGILTLYAGGGGATSLPWKRWACTPQGEAYFREWLKKERARRKSLPAEPPIPDLDEAVAALKGAYTKLKRGE